MASFMPAACSPCAIDHAIERLLATPKTTAFRPCKSEDMGAPWEWKRISVQGKELPRRRWSTEGLKRFSSRSLGPLLAHFAVQCFPVFLGLLCGELCRYLGPN